MHEQRRYVRMNTVFPVEFEIHPANGVESSSGLRQGFTRDVSEGGMCIEFKTFAKRDEELLRLPSVRLDLTINPTFAVHPIKAKASIVWLKKEINAHSSKYLIGVAYQDIHAKSRQRLIGHAKRSVWVPRAASTGLLVLLSLFAVLWFHDQKLVSENRRLIGDLQSGAEKRSRVSEHLQGLDDRKKQLEAQLLLAQQQIKKMQAALDGMGQENAELNQQSVALSAELTKQRADYGALLEESLASQQKIQMELEEIRLGEERLDEDYRRLEQQSKAPSSEVLSRMVQWLKSHQNLRTGLVASFEGDPTLDDAAFTYDQSLAVQVFLLYNEVGSAASVLSFYDKRAAKQSGVFYNAYDAANGSVLENTVHVGPNLWLGLAALHYDSKVRDGRFVPLARKIADWAIRFQDEEGGLRGGPDFDWYSTEHNLDAYAFFGLIYRHTGDEKYRQAQDRSRAWIKKYAYSVKEGRMQRGKGDATIATDTFGWAISAIGPADLTAMGLDPEAIMDFAEKNCQVNVDFRRPNGSTVRVTGFDFAKAQHLGRGGVVSTEWTAQMTVSYQVMARYLAGLGQTEKAAVYLRKSNTFLDELQKMVITSPSRTGQGRGCLPYASTDNVDTGHGWRTPKGSTTGSVAATAYGIFAWKGYNPFEMEDKHAGTE